MLARSSVNLCAYQSLVNYYAMDTCGFGPAALHVTFAKVLQLTVQFTLVLLRVKP